MLRDNAVKSDPALPRRHATRRAIRAALIVLFLLPFVLVLIVTGILFLWENPWLLKWVWWPIPICWAIGYWLLRLAKRKLGAIWQPEVEIKLRWTDEDKGAWQEVLSYADNASDITTDQFLEFDTYIDATRALAEKLAGHYHPGSHNAIASLTIPEILTAAELAISDLRRFVERNLPGSHLMTIRLLQRASELPDRWSQIKPFYYVTTLLWSPWTALSRVAADQTVMNPVVEEFKSEGIAGIYRAFLLQVGKYLIELNSHRLKVGPDRWRELTRSAQGGPAPQIDSSGDSTPPTDTAAPTLQIAVVGQVKAGKSSLVNALIGRQKAAVDLLPLTTSIERHTLRPGATDDALILLDTPGYAHQGPKPDCFDETIRAVRESAMTILVMNACESAREPDCLFIRRVDTWFTAHPQFRRPPILTVLTHIDGLPPSLEWNPPYDGWPRPKPTSRKETNIREVVTDVATLLGNSIQGVVPVCTDTEAGHLYGLEEWVIPAFLNLLPQAQAKRLVDLLYAERDQHRITKVMTQLWNASSLLAKYHFCGPESVLPELESERDEEQDTNADAS